MNCGAYKAMILMLLLLFAPQVRMTEEKEEQKPTIATVDPDGVQRLDVLGGSHFFRARELKVSKEPGITSCSIAMKSPEAGMVFEEELRTAPKVIKFALTKEGTYRFYCVKKAPFLSSHREKGMKGVIRGGSVKTDALRSL